MRRTTALSISIGLLLITGCRDAGTGRVTIGSKPFTEQQLLAEMMALTAEQQGIRVERAIPYGRSLKCLAGVSRGVLDAYPEYSGTLLTLRGEVAESDPEQAAESTARALGAGGLRWLDPFGADSRYAIAVRQDFALRFGLETISDLEQLPQPPRFAVDEGFRTRPIDGLGAMARHYGLRIGEVVEFPHDERREIFDRLLDGEVDAAQVFVTDARVATHGVEILRDDREFFGAYLAAPLVRKTVLASNPDLNEAWEKLSGCLDQEALRELNRRVELGGEDFRDVARGHLIAEGLIAQQDTPPVRRDQLKLAVSPLTNQGGLAIRAAEAIREVMPARHLLVQESPDPAQAVRIGEARFGLIGAESFFDLDEEGGLVRVEDLEAVGVVGTRFAHLVASSEAAQPGDWSRLGVGARGGASWQVARLILDALGLQERIELVELVNPEEVGRELADGTVDARLIMATAGDVGVMKLLQDGNGKLVSLDVFRQGSPALRYPFLRQGRIPANTYPGQPDAIPTITGQTVLATRVPTDEVDLGRAGPGLVPGVITRLPRRLPFETAERINQALDAEEMLDPTLPFSPGLAPETPDPRPRLQAAPLAATLNLLAIAFLVAMVILLLQRMPDDPALRPGLDRQQST